MKDGSARPAVALQAAKQSGQEREAAAAGVLRLPGVTGGGRGGTSERARIASLPEGPREDAEVEGARGVGRARERHVKLDRTS